MLAEIHRHDGQTTLTFLRALGHTPAVVWTALTESEHMQWWMPADMTGERGPGAVMKMTFWPNLVARKGIDPDAGEATITGWTPLQAFEWMWHGSRIRFDLAVGEPGTQLTLTVTIDTDEPEAIIDNAGGYHLWVEHLIAHLDHGATIPIANADATNLQDRYRHMLSSQ